LWRPPKAIEGAEAPKRWHKKGGNGGEPRKREFDWQTQKKRSKGGNPGGPTGWRKPVNLTWWEESRFRVRKFDFKKREKEVGG